MSIRSPFNERVVEALAADEAFYPEDQEQIAALIEALPEKTFRHPMALVRSLVKADFVDGDDRRAFPTAVAIVGPVIADYKRLRRNHGDLFGFAPCWAPKECQPKPAPHAPVADDIPSSGVAAPQPRSSVMYRTNALNRQPIAPATRFEITETGEQALVNAGKRPAKNGGPSVIMRGLSRFKGGANAAAKIEYFGEIRTHAGKVKFRTEHGYASAEEAAAATFAGGPDWARECVTYASVQTHRR